MASMRRFLAGLLSLALFCGSTPAMAASRLAAPKLPVAPRVVLSAAIPTLPSALSAVPGPTFRNSVTPIAAAPLVAQEPVAALAQLRAAEPTPQRAAEPAAAATFDGAAQKPQNDLAIAAGGLALPVAGLGALSLGDASYMAANGLSVAFPLPQVYKTYKQGHAREFPVVRAALGAFGTIALGLVNAPVLDKPFWGAMHIFVGLGMLAPYFIGKWLEKRNAPERKYIAPAAAKSSTARLAARLKGDGALGRALLTSVPLLAASAALYAGAAAFVPGALAAALTPAASDSLLLGLQLFKAALFVAVFAPDVVALVKGRPPKGFTLGFNLVFFASVAAFAAWGFTAASVEPSGPIKDQYLVLAWRNLGEAVAASLSLAAIGRAYLKSRRANP